MTVSKKNINPLAHLAQARISQLEEEIASAELERRRIRAEYVIARRKQKTSLRVIGEEIGLSHVGVYHIIRLHEAANGPIAEAGQNK